MTNHPRKTPSGGLDPEQVDSVEGGMLASLWRRILKDLNLARNIPYLARQAEIESRRADSDTTKVKTRTQYITQATASSMTFKIFVRLLRYIAGVCKFRLTIEIERANGKTTVHSTPFFSLGKVEKTEEEDLTPPKLLDKIKEIEKQTRGEGKDGKEGV